MDQRQARLIKMGALIAALVIGPGVVQLAWLSWRQHCLTRQQRRLEALYQQLAQEQHRLTHDPVYVEGLVRSTFKVAKPDELVVPLEPSESDVRTPVTRDR